eukprot:g7840.t1
MEPLPPSEPSSVEVISENRESTRPEESLTSSTSETKEGTTHTSEKVEPSPPSEPSLEHALDTLQHYQLLYKDDTYAWFLPATYFIVDMRLKEAVTDVKQIAHNVLRSVWNDRDSIFPNPYNARKLERFIHRYERYYTPPEPDSEVSDGMEEDPRFTEAETILLKAQHKARNTREQGVTLEQDQYMLEYIRLNKTKLYDPQESYELHINALKHPKYYPSLIQDRLCSLATNEDYSKIPAYLKRCLQIGKDTIYKEQKRKQKGYPSSVEVISENREST